MSMGLSPRVRGNPCKSALTTLPARSIPACAGEPSATARPHEAAGVYPRVCGGTDAEGNALAVDDGLSPRVRGNPTGRQSRVSLCGSIPACAGEPGYRYGDWRCHRVYPRVCGGTAIPPLRCVKPIGLSPRVRGNPRSLAFHQHIDRSIPACAGEPP